MHVNQGQCREPPTCEEAGFRHQRKIMMTHAKMTTVPADMREPSPREVVSRLRERHVPYPGAGPRARLGR